MGTMLDLLKDESSRTIGDLMARWRRRREAVGYWHEAWVGWQAGATSAYYHNIYRTGDLVLEEPLEWHR